MLKEQRFNFRINQISRNVCALGVVNKIVPKRSSVLLWYSLVSCIFSLCPHQICLYILVKRLDVAIDKCFCRE